LLVAIRGQALRYPSRVEWTATTIRRFREVGLCLSQDQFATTLGFTKRTIGNAERGAHPPSLALRRALDHALEKASDAPRDRFLAADHGAAPAIQATSPTLESVELLRRAEASDLGTGTLEQLEELVEQLGMEYFTVPPAHFRETVLAWRRYVARLLDGTVTLRERHHLYAVAGWLSDLVAEASLALGEHAEPHCTTALSLAQQIGDARLAGWVRAVQALEIRSEPQTRSFFSFDEPYVPYYAGTTYVWLGETARARAWAVQAIELCDADPVPWPVARTSARVDLAVALAQAGEHDGSATVGSEAMDIWAERPTHPARKRIEELLAALRPFAAPCTVELRERWRWIST
jgi:DNA-binding XRE family transcriptional regulator